MTKFQEGNVLYYPYINFQNEDWLRRAILYYDKLSRIVPKNYDTSDTHTVNLLQKEYGIIENLAPEQEASEISDDFFNFAEKNLLNKKNRQRIYQEISGVLPPDSTFTIHDDKLGYTLKQRLPNLNLIQYNSNSDWYEFDHVTGSLYMTFLANRIAERRGLSIVTDDSAFQPFVRDAQLNGYQNREDTKNVIVSVVIKNYLPDNISEIPIKYLIDYRDDYKKYRYDLHSEINYMINDSPKIVDSDAYEEFIRYNVHKIESKINDLKMSFTEIGEGLITGLLAFSFPFKVERIHELPSNIKMIGTSACGVLGIKNKLELRKNSPLAYILNMQYIDNRKFINKLIRRIL